MGFRVWAFCALASSFFQRARACIDVQLIILQLGTYPRYLKVLVPRVVIRYISSERSQSARPRQPLPRETQHLLPERKNFIQLPTLSPLYYPIQHAMQHLTTYAVENDRR